jgi:hypothetical protein
MPKEIPIGESVRRTMTTPPWRAMLQRNMARVGEGQIRLASLLKRITRLDRLTEAAAGEGCLAVTETTELTKGEGNMGQKQVIAVVGATGMQGGGLVRAILADPASGFTVRALTRDVNSEKARELSGDSARRWWRPMCMTSRVSSGRSRERPGHFASHSFWAHMSPEREFAEAEAMAKAAQVDRSASM